MGPNERPTIPAMHSVSEADYRASIAGGMTVSSLDDPRYADQRRDTQRRIRLLQEFQGGER